MSFLYLRRKRVLFPHNAPTFSTDQKRLLHFFVSFEPPYALRRVLEAEVSGGMFNWWQSANARRY